MNAQARYLMGLAVEYIQKGSLEDADRLLNQALKMEPKNSEALRLRGIILAFKKMLPEALRLFDQSIKADSRNWLSYSNRGNVLKDLHQLDEALRSYNKTISLQPNYAEVYNNKGNVLLELNEFQESVASYCKAITLNPTYADAHHGMGNSLKKIGNLTKALESYGVAASLNPLAGHIASSYISTKMQMCRWNGLQDEINYLLQLGLNSDAKIHPFHLLSICNDPALLSTLTEQYMLDAYPVKDDLGLIEYSKKVERIRIGYFSADFHGHPVSLLVAEMLELHDHTKFETIGFSMGRDQADEMRLRMEGAFDSFVDISLKNDRQVAELARDLKIDIAVDLGGLTENNRPGIFSYRVAPIQMSYLGYLGTMGASYYDYLIADQTIIPPSQQSAYREKIIYLPSFQANDSRRWISSRVFSRSDLGLPDEGFVYCCFNNNYKITPTIFDSWAKILLSVEGSVLLLYADNEEVKINLSREIEVRGVSGDRLIFAGRLSREEYLARYRAADLFLDTSPYNSGTTASDALWAGLPVLTFLGRSFSARMCGSLLTAIGLPELVASSQLEYEELAIGIGKDSEMISRLKNKLTENRLVMPLFDTKLFTQNLEIAYKKAYERGQLRLPPDHIY